MSETLILSYRLKEVTNSYVLHHFELHRIVHISATTCPIEMGFGPKCSIFNEQVIYIEKCDSFYLIVSQLLVYTTFAIRYSHSTMNTVRTWSFLAKVKQKSPLGNFFESLFSNSTFCLLEFTLEYIGVKLPRHPIVYKYILPWETLVKTMGPRWHQ